MKVLQPRVQPEGLPTTHRAGLWFAAALLLGLCIANVVATHNLLTQPYPGQNDFLARWESARAFWRDGVNPYSDEATLRVQLRMYGRPVEGDEDPNLFAYPMYTVWVMLPLVFFGYAWASAVWIVVLEAALVVALVLLLDLYRWRPPPWLLAGFALWTLTHYFAVRGLMLGQPAAVVYLMQVITLWALARGQDRAAGVALALSTIKPQMGFLLVPLLLAWAWRRRRWQFLGAFAVLWGGLLATSFLVLPSWLTDWLGQLRAYPSYTAIGSPVWVATVHYLGLGLVGEWAVNLFLWALLAWVWWDALWRDHEERLAWAVMLALVVTHLSALRTATPHFVVFTIPLVFYFKRLARRRGAAWTALLLFALAALPWVQFLLTVGGKREHESMYVPVPFAMLILLWVTRHWWWESGPLFTPRHGAED